MGMKLARALSSKAISHGRHPTQERMTTPMNVKGVGNGSQQCSWKVTCPIATPTTTGRSTEGMITSPIVEGAGGDLPGLLGLRTIEQHRGIIDTGRREFIFAGQGDVQITVPPGSVRHPLEKAPSGHLVLVVDDFDNVKQNHGGITEEPLQLMTTGGTSHISQDQATGSGEAADDGRGATSRSASSMAPAATGSRSLDM